MGTLTPEARHVVYMSIKEKLEDGKFEDLGKWRKLLDHNGSYLLVRVEKNGVCSIVDKKDGFVKVVKHAMNHSKKVPDGDVDTTKKWSLRDIKDCAEYIRDLFAEIKMPKSFGMYGDTDPCFSRLSFEPRPMETPLWDAWLKMHMDPIAFTSWYGSVFFPGSDMSQYLWIWGDGGNGKSTFANFVQHCLGNAYVPLRVPEGDGRRFFGASLIGKRFGCFTEVRKPKFGRSGLILDLTGGTPIEVEPKGGTPWSVTLDSKIMLCSNFRPELSTQASENRRMVLCEIKCGKITPTAGYQEAFNAEAPGIIHKCMESYKANVLDKSAVIIPVSCEELAKASAGETAEYEDVLERYFELSHLREVNDNKNYLVNAAEVSRILKLQEKWSGTQISKWKAWLRREHNIEAKQVRVGPENRHRYVGMKTKKGLHLHTFGHFGDPER